MPTEFEYVMSISEKLESGKWIAVVKQDVIKGDSAKRSFRESEREIPKKRTFHNEGTR